ncbi:MAG: hypothetical protein Q8Q11_02460 [bacterium]|nr:hypothetical protein [bacterium]
MAGSALGCNETVDQLEDQLRRTGLCLQGGVQDEDRSGGAVARPVLEDLLPDATPICIPCRSVREFLIRCRIDALRSVGPS